MRYLILDLGVQLGVGQLESVRLETGIPTEIAPSPRFHDQPVGSPHEQLGFFILGIAVGECAKGESGFVLESVQHLEQTLGLQGVQEPFDVGSGQSFERVEPQTRVFDDDRRTESPEGLFALFAADLVGGALVFGQVDLAADDVVREIVAQNGQKLLELLGVARDEGDALAAHFFRFMIQFRR